MKTLLCFISTMMIASCATHENPMLARAPAQVGIVNHTANFIYSASVDGDGGGSMSKWGAGIGEICCASIPKIWRPGIVVLVRWDMPEDHQHIVKEKLVEVEKYERPGDIYLHFFPDDVIRVVVSNTAGWGKSHPIPPPTKPDANLTEKSTAK